MAEIAAQANQKTVRWSEHLQTFGILGPPIGGLVSVLFVLITSARTIEIQIPDIGLLVQGVGWFLAVLIATYAFAPAAILTGVVAALLEARTNRLVTFIGAIASGTVGSAVWTITIGSLLTLGMHDDPMIQRAILGSGLLFAGAGGGSALFCALLVRQSHRWLSKPSAS